MARARNSFDVMVIGSGSAGFSAAEAAHARGARVAIVESGDWGGECPNSACVPTKSLLASAKAYYHARHELAAYGVHAGSVRFNLADILRRKQDVVSAITGNHERLKKTAAQLGIEAIDGSAEFASAHELLVNGQVMRADAMVIATGSVDAIPPIDGLAEAGYWTYKDAVNLRSLPRSIAIIGGGPVGCEFATFFGLLGVTVHLLQLSGQILEREDAEIAALANERLTQIGVKIHTNAKTLSVERIGRARRVTFQVGRRARQTLDVSDVLLAVGKRPNIASLKVENAGVRLNNRGQLVMRDTLQTSVDHIFAAGDVSGAMLFTHTAHHEGEIAGWNAVEPDASRLRTRDLRVVPRVTFTYPELASVGMTSKEAVQNGHNILIGTFPIGALGRAVTDGTRTGLLKLVADASTRQVLGGHMLGEHAGEVIHEIALAIQHGITSDDLARMIHAFPTYAEAVPAAAARME